ncbi:uncharacterized protein LOC114265633 [Camellia sinensis]|uniref:uncharacterized protein LOC114265633 n=1 Tax=Camellia sinensis TaxID=4442 RepID=UPI001036A965|nr:uncharacterized protein LOC114265633 [Camellia sinensis]
MDHKLWAATLSWVQSFNTGRLALNHINGAAAFSVVLNIRYTVPKFVHFDGRKGNAREHVLRFLDALGVHREDRNLRIREFSKSLTDRAFSWYANLAAGFISSWEDLVKKFYIKFFYVEERLTTLHLMRETQRLGEDILVYIRRFREKAVDIQDPIEEHQLVSMCIEGMLTTYKLQEVPQPHSWRAAASPPFLWRPNRRNHAVYAAGGFNGGRTNLQAKKGKFDQVPPPLLISVDEAQALLNAWVEDGKVHLPEPRQPVIKNDQAWADYCIYHHSVKHPTVECWVLRSLVRKMMADDILELPRCQT